MTYISLERSRRVEQHCPLCQSDPWMTGGARGRQSRNFFRGFFHFEDVLIVNWPSEFDLSRSRIDRINSFWDIANWNSIFIKTIVPAHWTSEFCSSQHICVWFTFYPRADSLPIFEFNKIFIYILIDKSKSGVSAIAEYCCQCRSGLRTAGCAHVMTVLWYLGFGRHLPQDKLHRPAAPLNEFYINLNESDTDCDWLSNLI